MILRLELATKAGSLPSHTSSPAQFIHFLQMVHQHHQFPSRRIAGENLKFTVNRLYSKYLQSIYSEPELVHDASQYINVQLIFLNLCPDSEYIFVQK